MKNQKLTSEYVKTLNKFTLQEDTALDDFKQMLKPGERVVIQLPSLGNIPQGIQDVELVDTEFKFPDTVEADTDKEASDSAKKEAASKEEISSLNAQLAAKVREAAALNSEYQKVVALGPEHWGPGGEIVKSLFKSKSKAEEEQINLVIKIHGI